MIFCVREHESPTGSHSGRALISASKTQTRACPGDASSTKEIEMTRPCIESARSATPYMAGAQ